MDIDSKLLKILKTLIKFIFRFRQSLILKIINILIFNFFLK